MDISVSWIASALTNRSIEGLYFSRHQRVAVVRRHTYCYKVAAFNITTILLVASVALAVFSLYLQTSLLLGALSYVIRNAVHSDLNRIVEGEIDEAIDERVDHEANALEMIGKRYLVASGFYLPNQEMKRNCLLSHFDREADDPWEPDSVSIFDTIIFKTMAPELRI